MVSSVGPEGLMNKFLSWFALSISSSFFTGFLGRRGRGGGTYGSLVGLAIAALILWRGGGFPIALVAVVVSFLLGMATIDLGETLILRRWGPRRRHTGELVVHDYNETNIDEVFGQLIACLPIFLVSFPASVQVTLGVAAFVLFRIFDAYKPGLVGWAEERWDGSAFGIMIDDGVAGLFAAVGITLIVMIVKIVTLGLAINEAWSGLAG